MLYVCSESDAIHRALPFVYLRLLLCITASAVTCIACFSAQKSVESKSRNENIMANQSDRRLRVLQAHLQSAHPNERKVVEMQTTAANVEDSPQEYSVVLPERLSNPGPWTVRRY